VKKREPLMVEVPSVTERVLNQVLEEALSPRSKELLERGLEDARAGRVSEVDIEAVKKQCGLDTQCPMCGSQMEPEHAHYRCRCGYRDSCCM
jgi:hypothetical protein